MNELLRYKNIIVAIIIVVVFAIVAKNVNAHYTAQKAEIKAQEKVLEEGRKTIAKWFRVKADYQELAGKFFSNDTLLLKKLVEEKAQEHQLEIGSVRVRNIDKDFYWEAIVQIDAACSYTDFSRFISSLEDRDIEVERIRINESEGMIRVSAELKGIVLK